MTCKFFNIIDYSILGFQHLIYVLECIYIIILYQPGQLVYFPNKFSTISLISILSNERHPFLIGYIQRTLQVMASSRFEIIRQSVINNASVIYNHLIYFNGMSSPTDCYQTAYLYPASKRSLGSVEQFLTKSKEMRCLYLVLATCGSFLTLTLIYKLSQLPTRVLS